MSEWRGFPPFFASHPSGVSARENCENKTQETLKSRDEKASCAVEPENFSSNNRRESSSEEKSSRHSERKSNDHIFVDWTERIRHPRLFPFRFVINCAMLILLILLITLYITPEHIADEAQHKAVLYHFLGENYIGKDKGDIVIRPTLYLHTREDVLKGIKHFVNVYYALSNTSVTELKYFYYAHGDEAGKSLLKQVLYDKPVHHLRAVYAMLHGSTGDNDGNMGKLNSDWIEPVDMNIEVFLYSQQEHRGPAPVRRFVYKLTDKDPLGPFSNDGTVDEEDDEDEDDERNKNKNNINNINSKVYNRVKRHKSTKERNMIYSFNNDAYFKAACATRYDDITGLYYNPCRSSHKANDKSGGISSYKNGIATQDTSDNGFLFPLLDNTRHIQLRASVRHMVDTRSIRQDHNTGFSMVVYHFTVEKSFLFHSGGLVEVTFDVSVNAKYIGPRLHSRFFFTAALIMLAIVDIALRSAALRRISVFRRTVLIAQQVAQEESLCCVESIHDCKDMVSSPKSKFDVPVSESTEDIIRAEEGSGGLAVEGSGTISIQTSSSGTVTSDVPLRTSKSFLQRMRACLPRRSRTVLAHNACSLIPETTYTDFYDAWRTQLKSSRGGGWHYISISADFFTIIYGIMAVLRMRGFVTTEPYEICQSIVLGLAGMFLSVSLQSYFRFFPKMYFTVRATRNVIPELLFFAMTVAPLFIGFAFFFWIVFGPHSNGEFTDMGFSMIALYFMMYGDALLPAIENAQGSVYPIVGILANLMTVIFVFLFMMTMLNLAMSITQQEWGLLRRRFGACLSVGNLLVAVRSREQVKREAMETIIANLELLLHIRHEEELRVRAMEEEEPAVGDPTGGGGDNDINEADQNNSINNNSNNNNNNNNSHGSSLRDDASFALQRREVSEMYRRRLDELTEGILDDAA
ncbi:Polycystin cation channel [Trypanosoma melophagium]|uniref:Polycystin cation channel n=1 Tax=Trypanosoma melophagium TaxID=715481 RepID=UPI00351A9C71|nr:Polycystin cation channel [Trypanosoma melophagium]